MALPASLALIDALLKRVSAEVTQHEDVRSGDATKLRSVVETKLLPHVDTRRVTQTALGPNWRRATPEQQDQLVREFTALLVRTYSGALASYRDQTIEFLPLRGGGDTEVTVRSRIRQAGAEAMIVEYDLAKTDADWKVYDVRVDGLISTLSAKNRA